MKKQNKSNWQIILFIAIAIVFVFGASSTVLAQKSIGANYGSREPRTCEETKAPTKGAITAALAAKYLNCQMEGLSGGNLYLVENVKVQVGGGIPYAAIMGQRSLSEIDVNVPVYPIRGSLVLYQCSNRLTAARFPDANCSTYNNPKATGYCYKTTFGDWRCNMNDPAANSAENIVHDVPPPKGANNASTDKTMPKDTNQNAETKKVPDAVERDDEGFPKPDFSEMEKYVEIVKHEYNPIDGRVTMVVKAKKEINIYRWYMTAYDADGVKISELSLNGGSIPLPIGEPTRIYSFAPNEKDIRRVARIAIVRKLD